MLSYLKIILFLLYIERINGDLEINITKTVNDLPIINIYMYHGYIPLNKNGGLKGSDGLHNGNIQDLCLQNKNIINGLKCRMIIPFLDYDNLKLKDHPFYYQFSEKSLIYGVKMFHSNEYYEHTNNNEYIYLGTWEKVINQKKLKMSFSEAGVLPMGAKFWFGDGCNNWSSGKKIYNGNVGNADFKINYLNFIKPKCNKMYHWFCGCLT